ncbi:universal stress protein [Oceanicella actignis]|uniref:universal stress protein n=1 Tax=Oceanicella actignis TaxID=1189325 RepID=UPI0011E70C79|nr:universal stress protein [Oceanicella actignis]TYO89198.1 nucleotide-binding universal stress UspA family protein [Oceanicella actignis]
MRKFLVVVDETPECLNAIRFAARRAAKTGGGVQMLFVIRPEEFQHWIGVAEVMRQEAREAAEARFQELAETLRETAGVMPEFVIREGEAVEQILAQIREDPQIGVLVLGAGAEGDGPGPLVSQLAGRMAGRMPVPITVVPGSMSEEQLDMVC